MNKTDLVTEQELDQLETRIRSMNAMAKVYRSKDAAVEMEKILNVGGFDLERALSVKPTFLKPEYPFEWAGVYSFSEGVYELQLTEGPDPSMNLLFLKTDGEDLNCIELLLETALRGFSSAKTRLSPGQSLAEPGQLYQLNLEQSGNMSFTFKPNQKGNYVLFTQHLPEEFAMSVKSHELVVPPLVSNHYQAGHTHDDEISSVGITCSGNLDDQKFNNWLGALLREKGTDIFRMKGILSIDGQAERFVFQGVHMLFDGKPDKPWGTEERSNQLIFIGRNLNRLELTEGFNACLKKNPQLSLR